MLHGCIPVVVMDDVDPVFSSILDWNAFSLRVAEVTPPGPSSPFSSAPPDPESCFHQTRQSLRIGAVLHEKTASVSRHTLLLQFPCIQRECFCVLVTTDACSAAVGHEERLPLNFVKISWHPQANQCQASSVL